MPSFRHLLTAFLLLISFSASAQTLFTISGTIIDEEGLPMPSATVFINGSKKIMPTNAEGKFLFKDITPGTFQLSVQMIGYSPYDLALLVKDHSLDVNIKLRPSTTMLKQVTVGIPSQEWENNYAIFKKAFLGASAGAKASDIQNPRVLSFKKDRYNLQASSDEFLMIENRWLGYKISYQLKAFNYGINIDRLKLDGNASFEEMDGTPEQKQTWAKNRLEAYRGSLMHFFRSVYANTALQEGFVTNQLYLNQASGFGKVLVFDPRPLKFDTIVTVIDTAFISLKFKSLYVEFDPQKARKLANNPVDTTVKKFVQSGNGTVLNLYLPQAVIDGKGSYTDYRAFLVQGYWGGKRIGDQLPFEYQPFEIRSPAKEDD